MMAEDPLRVGNIGFPQNGHVISGTGKKVVASLRPGNMPNRRHMAIELRHHNPEPQIPQLDRPIHPHTQQIQLIIG
jgi:hypothetical protein